jgi:hypothetical protein
MFFHMTHESAFGFWTVELSCHNIPQHFYSRISLAYGCSLGLALAGIVGGVLCDVILQHFEDSCWKRLSYVRIERAKQKRTHVDESLRSRQYYGIQCLERRLLGRCERAIGAIVTITKGPTDVCTSKVLRYVGHHNLEDCTRRNVGLGSRMKL